MVNKSCFGTEEFSPSSFICESCIVFERCGKKSIRYKNGFIKSKRRVCKGLRNNGRKQMGTEKQNADIEDMLYSKKECIDMAFEEGRKQALEDINKLIDEMILDNKEACIVSDEVKRNVFRIQLEKLKEQINKLEKTKC